MTQLTLTRWNIAFGGGAPLVVIAGLNVIEDLALALHTATTLKAICNDLGLPYVFKASYDKANRSSLKSYRGPGLEKGLEILAEVKAHLNVPIATDIHTPEECEPVAAVADLVQIPAFLCRQTDLVVAAARATQANHGLLHVKKGQFLAPWDCKNILDKVKEATGGAD
ncbi:MAG: kdsA, partial [Caulobacter sp.]|nr:kdsA [Caulobacter sp.]